MNIFVRFQVIIMLCALLIPRTSEAQESTDYPKCQPFDSSFFTPHSPDVWSMVKYGDAETNLYTGTLGLSIPIYEYEDMSFHLPIAVQYTCNGYKPNVQAGLVGLGWYLNVGGAITREVRGIPDESTREAYYWTIGISAAKPGQQTLYGYEHMFDERDLALDCSYWGMISNDYIATYVHPLPPQQNAYPNICYETEPDIFHFNFMGYSGSFVRRPNGEFVVYNTNKADGEFRVSGSCGSGFTIITGDGYRYSFGENGISETVTCYTEGQSDDGNNYASSWSLTSVSTPDGATIEFEYGTIKNNFPTELCSSWSCYPRVYQEKKYVRHIASAGHSLLNIQSPDNNALLHDIVVNKTQIHPITKIRIDDVCEILFEYAPRAPEKWGNITGISNPGYLFSEVLTLTDIRVVSTNGQKQELIRTCHFDYDRIGGENTVPVLSEVTVSDVGTYSMQYYGTDKNFPPINTFGIDWWGYYNDPWARPSDFEPALTTSTGLKHLSPNYSQRNADAQYAIYGMLQQITYPTGGRSVFSYEGNTYSMSVNRNHDTGYKPSIQRESGVAGGVRISRIIDYKDDSDFGICRSFSYTNVDGSSSGTLLWGRPAVYTQYYLSVTLGFSQVEREMLSTQHSFPYSMNNHIEYGRIVETRYAVNVPDKKSITEYLYKTYKQNEDTEDRFPKLLEGQLNADISLGGTRSFIENMLLTPFSKSALRGKIEKKCYYADDLSPTNKLYEENYYYTTTDSKYIAYPKLALGELHEQRINIENPQLSSVERTYYNDGVPAIYTRTFYEYNDLGQLHSSTVADSKGTDITTAYVYPHEIPHPSDAEITLSVNNIVNTPVCTIKMHADSSRVLAAEKAIYFHPHPDRDVAKVHRMQTAMIEPATRPDNIVYLDQQTYDRYDYQGHPLQTTDKSGTSTCYIWGYNGLYIVARIENATFAQIAPLLPPTIEQQPLATNLDALSGNVEASLRALPDVHVTTYAYEPLVGITRITDPSGRDTSYEYDADGRLIRIRDDAGKPTNEYLYHIVNR